MGKTLEKDSSKPSLFANKKTEELSEIQLPVPLPCKEEVLERLRGYNIAIYNEEIVAINKSLKQLHKTLEKIIPKGKRCVIEFIEEGAYIYGFTL